MKYLVFTFIGIATILIIYNATFLDFSDLFGGESGVALTGILAGACVILLMLILRTSRSIAKKKK